MSFLHCHTKGCNWSQDDWWNFSFGRYGYWKFPFTRYGWAYNPFSVFLSNVFTKKGYWFPRRIKFDRGCMEENKWKRIDPHSWWLAWREFKKIFWRFKRQKWWTEKTFKKDYAKGIAVCPNCGSSDEFDID